MHTLGYAPARARVCKWQQHHKCRTNIPSMKRTAEAINWQQYHTDCLTAQIDIQRGGARREHPEAKTNKRKLNWKPYWCMFLCHFFVCRRSSAYVKPWAGSTIQYWTLWEPLMPPHMYGSIVDLCADSIVWLRTNDIKTNYWRTPCWWVRWSGTGVMMGESDEDDDDWSKVTQFGKNGKKWFHWYAAVTLHLKTITDIL